MNDAIRNALSKYFERDHDEIDAILASVNFSDAAGALARFKEFDRRLERHIVWEESILFPAAGIAAPPLEMGPIPVMMSEHVAIRAAKAEALSALADGDGARAENCVKVLLEVLKPHNMKEEQILYPACDQLISEQDAADILERVKSGC